MTEDARTVRSRCSFARQALRVSAATARFTLTFFLLAWLIGVAALGCGGRLAGWHASLAAVVAMAAALHPMRSAARRFAAGATISCLCAGSLVLALCAPDVSYDGLYYHQPATYALADGWNPFYGGAKILEAHVAGGVGEVILGYPKAPWIVGAQLYLVFGQVWARHALHVLLLVAAFGFAWGRLWAAGRSRAGAALLAASWAANPVVLYQLTTSYVDGIVASLLSICIVGWVTASSHGRRRALLAVAIAAALLVGTKLTGLYYVVVLWIGGITMARAGAARRDVAWTGAAALVLGVALASDAYVGNTVRGGHPFHVAVQDDRSILDGQASPAFLQVGRIEQVLRSLATHPHSDRTELDALPAPRWPLTNWRWWPRYDPRFSGFGPLTLEILALSVVLLLAARSRHRAMHAAITLTVFQTGAGWWARLAPQTWCLFALAASTLPRARWLRVTRIALIAALFVNVLWVTAASGKAARSAAKHWRAATQGEPSELLDRLSRDPGCRAAIQRVLGDS